MKKILLLTCLLFTFSSAASTKWVNHCVSAYLEASPSNRTPKHIELCINVNERYMKRKVKQDIKPNILEHLTKFYFSDFVGSKTRLNIDKVIAGSLGEVEAHYMSLK